MIKEIKQLAKERGYVVYEKPGFLNIWGFRANNSVPNTFDDQIHVFTIVEKDGKKVWAYWVFKCTTDPGTFWLHNPEHRSGTAILNPGQYKNSHAIGLHRGKYTALVQIGPLKVTRDYNRDNVLDFDNGNVITGTYGINIHRASKIGNTLKVEKYSAGCQVFKNAKDFEFFISLCQKHRKLYGNKFTYTLIDKHLEKMGKLKEEATPEKAIQKQFDLKPKTYAVFDPKSIAETIFAGVQKKDITKVLKALYLVRDVTDYKQVTEYIKKKEFGSETGKTISYLLSKVFPSDPHRQKYRSEFYRIGLKWNGKNWSLAGLEEQTSALITNQSAVIWDNSGHCFMVQNGAEIGTFVSKSEDVTTFLASDGKQYSILSSSIKSHD